MRFCIWLLQYNVEFIAIYFVWTLGLKARLQCLLRL